MHVQTLSILIQNIRKRETIYCLFSNNHLNKIAGMTFDFQDDEILALFVNLLKTISLRLDEHTVHFFFNENSNGTCEAHKCTFPLYTEAIKFGTDKDAMVRAAVKNLTLNTFTIPLVSLRDFFGQSPTSFFFSQLAESFIRRCRELDAVLVGRLSKSALPDIERHLTDLEDETAYFNDIWSTNIPILRYLLLDKIWIRIVREILHSFVAEKGLFSPMTALYSLEVLFSSVQHECLVSLLASLILGGDSKGIANDIMIDLNLKGSTLSGHPVELDIGLLTLQDELGNDTVRDTFIKHLDGNDAYLINGCIRLVCSLLKNGNVSEDVLYMHGLLPNRRRRQKDLLDELTRHTLSPIDDTMDACTVSSGCKDSTVSAENIESHPMRHSEVFESNQHLDGDEASVLLKSLINCTRCEGISPIALLGLCWIFNLLLDGISLTDWTDALSYARIELSSVQKGCKKLGCALLEIMVKSPWTDAVPSLIEICWKKQYTLSQQFQLLSPRAAVYSWEQIHLLESIDSRTDHLDMASSAKSLLLRIQSLLSCLQLYQLLSIGFISESTRTNFQVSDIENVAQKECKIGKYSFADINAIPCVISFGFSIEREVSLKIENFIDSNDGVDGSGIEWYNKPAPVALLLDEESDKLTGPQEILSFAPVASSDPKIDANNARWLHVEVRPQMSTLLGVVQKSLFGLDSASIDKSIKQGHWIIAFPGISDARKAYSRLCECLQRIRNLSRKYVLDLEEQVITETI